MLIELAVASMVIGLALLALLGLGHIAERAATEAEGETRATLFADEVFTTLRLYSDYFSSLNSYTTNNTDWVVFWRSLQSGKLEIPLSPQNTDLLLDPSDSHHPRLIQGGYSEKIAYWQPRVSDSPNPDVAPDYAIRYRLNIGPRQSRNHDIQDDETMVLVTLHVWPGASRTGSPALTFFTSFSHSGTLP